jgi:hypothetical protein
MMSFEDKKEEIPLEPESKARAGEQPATFFR